MKILDEIVKKINSIEENKLKLILISLLAIVIIIASAYVYTGRKYCDYQINSIINNLGRYCIGCGYEMVVDGDIVYIRPISNKSCVAYELNISMQILKQ